MARPSRTFNRWRVVQASVLLQSACVVYAPPRIASPPEARPIRVVVLAEADDLQARTVAALLQRRADLAVEGMGMGDVERRLTKIAAARSTRLSSASAMADAALRSVERLDTSRARTVLAQAWRATPSVPSDDQEMAAWADVQGVEAVIELADGADGKAMALFRQLMAARPTYAPPSGRWPPEALALLRRAQLESDAAARALLSIESSPPGAQIYVNGVARGTGRVTVQLPPGRHFVSAAALGLRADPVAVDVGASPTVRLHTTVVLRPAPLEQAAQDAAGELQRNGMTHGTLRGVAGALAAALVVDYIVWLQGRQEAVLWTAELVRPRGVSVPVHLRTDDQRRNALALAGAIGAALDRIPSVAGPVTVHADTGSDSPWYRRWWGWCLAGAATVAAIVIVR